MKRVLKAFWKNRYWAVAFGFAWANVANVILNAGFFNVTIKSGAVEYHYYYYLGFTSGTAGILAGLILGVLISKVKTYLALDRRIQQEATYPPVSPGTNNAYAEISKYE